MFGCEPVCSVPVIVVAPEAPILVTPPNVVMFGCETVCKIPVNLLATIALALTVPTTPIPPATTNAPVVVEVDGVLLETRIDGDVNTLVLAT